MTPSKIPVRCKILIVLKIVEKTMKFRYLGIEISGYGDMDTESKIKSLRREEKLHT